MITTRKFIRWFYIFILVFNTSINIATAAPSGYKPTEGFADLVEPLMPAVVNVFMTHKPNMQKGAMPFPEGSPFSDFQQFVEKFMAPYNNNEPNEAEEEDGALDSKKLIPLGSGFIIDKTGYIVTNYHVVAEAQNKVAVKLIDGTELKAKVIGYDRKTDLALIKVQHNKPLPYVEFGNSDASRVGDWVIAIGNPFGIGTTVTSGIISANGRDIASEGIVDNFIQTDAAINRGNSGGPMFNMEGKVIGVNTAILSTISGGNIGIGFATPSSLAKDIIKQLKESGKVKRGKIGIRMQAISADIADSLSLTDTKGVLIVEVVEKSPAQKAGLKVGDVIVSFNNTPIKTLKELARIIGGAPIGKELPIIIVRKGKKETLQVTLAEDEDSSIEPNADEEEYELPKKQHLEFNPKEILGGQFATVTAELRTKFKLPTNTDGIVLLNMKRKSMWYSKGFRPGDVILSANQVRIDTADQFSNTVKAAKLAGKKSLLLLISRREYQFFTPVPLK